MCPLQVVYELVDGDPLHNFTLDRVTGELQPAAPLDYEALPGPDVFNLTVRAADLGTPR